MCFFSFPLITSIWFILFWDSLFCFKELNYNGLVLFLIRVGFLNSHVNFSLFPLFHSASRKCWFWHYFLRSISHSLYRCFRISFTIPADFSMLMIRDCTCSIFVADFSHHLCYICECFCKHECFSYTSDNFTLYYIPRL